jgi:hypothetical protein
MKTTLILGALLLAQDAITFEAPKEWTKEEPASTMRKAQYKVPDKEAKAKPAELAVFFFGANSGLLQANLERWAGQMGQADPKAEIIEGNHKIHLVDLKGTYTGDAATGPQENARMLAAVIEAPGGPWYFKLVGPADTVGDWREEYVKLLKAAKK